MWLSGDINVEVVGKVTLSTGRRQACPIVGSRPSVSVLEGMRAVTHERVRTLASSSSHKVLGRNLEALVNRAMELQGKWGDQFVSIEHLVMAMAEDTRFGEAMFRQEKLTKDKVEEVRQHRRRMQENVTVSCKCQEAMEPVAAAHSCKMYLHDVCIFLAASELPYKGVPHTQCGSYGK